MRLRHTTTLFDTSLLARLPRAAVLVLAAVARVGAGMLLFAVPEVRRGSK